jgi:hypothetical protein
MLQDIPDDSLGVTSLYFEQNSLNYTRHARRVYTNRAAEKKMYIARAGVVYSARCLQQQALVRTAYNVLKVFLFGSFFSSLFLLLLVSKKVRGGVNAAGQHQNPFQEPSTFSMPSAVQREQYIPPRAVIVSTAVRL